MEFTQRQSASAVRPASPDGEETLRELALSARDGDEAAFSRLHGRLAGGVRRFLVKRISGQDALVEDLVQQAWIGLWTALRSGRYDPDRSAVTTYLYAVAYKTWLSHVRSTGNRPAEELDRFADTLISESDPAGSARAIETIEAMRGCLGSTESPGALTADEQAVIRAGGEGLSEREIAARLGIAASTVNARKQSALNKLRLCMLAKGFAGFGEREGLIGE